MHYFYIEYYGTIFGGSVSTEHSVIIYSICRTEWNVTNSKNLAVDESHETNLFREPNVTRSGDFWCTIVFQCIFGILHQIIVFNPDFSYWRPHKSIILGLLHLFLKISSSFLEKLDVVRIWTQFQPKHRQNIAALRRYICTCHVHYGYLLLYEFYILHTT